MKTEECISHLRYHLAYLQGSQINEIRKDVLMDSLNEAIIKLNRENKNDKKI